MGIQGLLPLLKSIMLPIHIKDLEGCTVAVDTYSWLHKGALSCSRELCKGLSTSRSLSRFYVVRLFFFFFFLGHIGTIEKKRKNKGVYFGSRIFYEWLILSG